MSQPIFKVVTKCKNKHDVKQNKMEAWLEMDGIFIGFFNSNPIMLMKSLTFLLGGKGVITNPQNE
jgi:uncharacterized membrane protein YjfL (UPF0719 family)